jgi:ComF family protein
MPLASMLSSSPAWRALRAGQCELCRRWSASALCGSCVAQFAPVVARCARCGLRIGDSRSDSVCGECLRQAPPYGHCVVACDYAHPWSGLIAAWKFHGRLELSAALAERLASALARSEGGIGPVDFVLPMPLSATRRIERGYNQAWELARRVAALRRVQARADALERVLDAPAQAALARRERLANLRAAFVVPAPARADLRGRDLALVDDVLTTGATAAEATQALLRAGARSVQLWALARTPAPGAGAMPEQPIG